MKKLSKAKINYRKHERTMMNRNARRENRKMAREIYFRAFDKENKVMLTADVLAFEEYEPLKDQLARCENLMQYTGFKDKNGVEIFEGDYVRCKGTVFTKYVTLQVEMFPENHPDCIMLMSEDNHCHIGDVSEDLEVIGNIYMNPELQREKK